MLHTMYRKILTCMTQEAYLSQPTLADILAQKGALFDYGVSNPHHLDPTILSRFFFVSLRSFFYIPGGWNPKLVDVFAAFREPRP